MIVLQVRPKLFGAAAGSHRQSGSEFQTVGPATENARVPKVLRRTHRTDSWWHLADHRCWRL